MGGFGSGGHNRRRDALEGRNRLSIGTLKRRGLLRAGALASMSWKDNWDRPTGSIAVTGGDAAVTLSYSVRRDESEAWRQVEDRIELTRAPRPFGGAQDYFLCSRCSRRVSELAFGEERFACRSCLGLVHRSSQQGPTDRAQSRASKLRIRLGAEPGFENAYGRPKHMRHATFERLDAQIQAADAEVHDQHLRLLARLSRLDARTRATRTARTARAVAKGSFW
jgi:hypothetical protein